MTLSKEQVELDKMREEADAAKKVVRAALATLRRHAGVAS